MKTQEIKLNDNLVLGFDLLNEHTINLHILKNTFLRGQNFINYFKLFIVPLIFQMRIKKIMAFLPDIKAFRHIRIMAHQAGFKREGKFTKFSKINGKYYDTVIFSLNKEGE